MNVPKDYEEFFELLNLHKARYLIVGAHAVAFHGQPRFTGDIDIFVACDRKNADRLLEVVERFGFKNVGINKDDFLKPDLILQLGYPPFRIDILTNINGVIFKSAWKNRVKGTFGKHKVWYISKSDLIRNKRAVGRTQDSFDLELLGVKKRKR